ncbi:LamG domain-containing protein [Streptomyces sp. NPDC002680]|uniref:LamG domain-containing protein n=1 Tax=Streptomyces sp. NPDC002680 TaxID=3364659 RepID=UPI00368C1FA9
MPDNIMTGLNSISVDFDVWIDPAMGTPYFFYGLGNSSGANGNGYLFTTGNTFRTSLSLTDYTAKQDIQPSGAAYELPRSAWEHVTYTQTGTTGILYENGVEKARNTNVTITPGAIGGGTTTADYIGRSLYANDKYFTGRIRDFRVYDHALTLTEVQDRANEPAKHWEQLQELANYNCALAYFNDPNIGPVITFPSDYAGDLDNLQTRTDWTDSTGQTPTSWPTPTTAKSPLFTAAQVKKITDAAYEQIAPDADETYRVSVSYDGSDRMVVVTDAPASVTDPLLNTYPGQITLQAPQPDR